MNCRNHAVVAVVWSLAAIAVSLMVTLCALAVIVQLQGHEPSEKLLAVMKDVGSIALVALTALLARTSGEEKPTKTEIVNTTANPVPTDPQN